MARWRCRWIAAGAILEYRQWIEGHLGRYQSRKTAADYQQTGARYRSFEDWERDDLIANLVADLQACPEDIQLRMVWHFWHCDPDYGTRVAQGAGIDLERAKALPNLPGHPAPNEDVAEPTYQGGERESR